LWWFEQDSNPEPPCSDYSLSIKSLMLGRIFTIINFISAK
jgi:hypothetical protein